MEIRSRLIDRFLRFVLCSLFCLSAVNVSLSGPGKEPLGKRPILAVVTELDGKVWLDRDQEPRKRLRVGDVLDLPANISTGEGARVEVTMEFEVIRFGHNTECTIHAPESPPRIQVKKGELAVRTKKGSRGVDVVTMLRVKRKRGSRVVNAKAVAAIRGSLVEVRALGGSDFQVAVIHGEADVAVSGKKSDHLERWEAYRLEGEDDEARIDMFNVETTVETSDLINGWEQEFDEEEIDKSLRDFRAYREATKGGLIQRLFRPKGKGIDQGIFERGVVKNPTRRR